MCFYCCCSCLCNKFNAKCVEFTTLLFSLLPLISLILATFLIKKVHISIISFILLIALIIFFFLFIISITLIILWRKKCLINTSKNGGGVCLTKLCLAFSIVGMIVTIIWFALTRTNLYNTDHPCSNYSRPMKYDNETNSIYFRILKLSEEMEKFCEEKNDKTYYANICNTSEYLSLYCISPIVFIFAMILTCLWHNDSQRITSRMDACLPPRAMPKLNKMSIGRFNMNPNIFINDNSQRRKSNDKDSITVRGYKRNTSSRRSSFIQRGNLSFSGRDSRKSISVRKSGSNTKIAYIFSGDLNKNNGCNDVKGEDHLNVINE